MLYNSYKQGYIAFAFLLKTQLYFCFLIKVATSYNTNHCSYNIFPFLPRFIFYIKNKLVNISNFLKDSYKTFHFNHYLFTFFSFISLSLIFMFHYKRPHEYVQNVTSFNSISLLFGKDHIEWIDELIKPLPTSKWVNFWKDL